MTFTKRTTRRRGRKRRYRKRSSRMPASGGGTMTRPSGPLGQKFTFRSNYYDSRLLDPTITGALSHVYSLNNLFDPDTTGTGHQPLGYDQLMLMYDHYTVIGARARVTFTNLDPTYSQVASLHLQDNNTTTTSITTILENGMNKYVHLSPSGGSGSSKTITIGCNVSKFFGRKVLQGDKFHGTITTGPSDQVYLHVTAASVQGVDAGAVSCTIMIQYVAIFSEPHQLAIS